MKFSQIKPSVRYLVLLPIVSTALFAGTQASAQEATSEAQEVIEEILVIGSRNPARSAADSTSPIDIISAQEFNAIGNGADVTDNLRANVPSFNASMASGDGDTYVRPTSLRGLAPDQTLVLVGGKRRHRAALIAEFVPAAGKGAQGPNIGMLPSIAIKRVEVLRDGAAAQYGSDAIAGVINFVMKDHDEGGDVRVRYGQFYEGEQSYSVAANVGLPLAGRGFVNTSFEYVSNEALSRGVQRPNGQALIDAGIPGVGQDSPFEDAPFVQTWGRPEIESALFFVNAGYDLSATSSLYLQSNFADTFGRYRFFYRNGDNPATEGYDAHVTLTTLYEVWGYTGLPQGFTPFFDGEQEDFSVAAGIKGEFAGPTFYDFSVNYGFNSIDFTLNNTINQSLGWTPGSEPQRNFDVGELQQEEISLNADFTRRLSTSLHLAWGAEWRKETFYIIAGEPNSRVGVGSSGFKGFEYTDSGDFSRDNYALYAELEQDVSDDFLLQYALRFEDFSDFGSTTNGKVAARYHLNPSVTLRGALSTGFHAPTPGQANIQKVTTTFDNDTGLQVEQGLVPPTHPLALAAGGAPLKEEESTNYSLGVSIALDDRTTLTGDIYLIEVDDRIYKTVTIPVVDPATGVGSNVSFYTNALDIEASGLDLVLSTHFDWGATGVTTDLNFAYNHNSVDVVGQSAVGGILPVSAGDVEDIEESYPQDRYTITSNTPFGDLWNFMLRVNYYGGHYDERGRINGVDGGAPTKKLGSTIFVDIELDYEINSNASITFGASNLFDDYVDEIEDPYANRLSVGLPYARRTAANFEGGSWYLRGSYSF